MAEFLLASGSPRRKSLLRNLLPHYLAVSPDIPEQLLDGETPTDYTVRLAEQKARNAAGAVEWSGQKTLVVIGADTVVVHKGRILGKPSGSGDAKKILRQLRDDTHEVYSGLAVYVPDQKLTRTGLACSRVQMRDYTEGEIKAYVESGDPLDKAGAYGIQHRGFHPAPDFSDCFANVMGLPLCHLAKLLHSLDISGYPDLPERCQSSLEYDCPVYQEILGMNSDQAV